MKKAIICTLILCSIMLNGCRPATNQPPVAFDTSKSAWKSEADHYSGTYDDDRSTASLYDEEALDGQPVFEPYELKIQRNELSIYDKPGYNAGNWLYDITDRRTIIIVAEETVRENGNTRIWGQLSSGGWTSLTAAGVVEDEETADANNAPAESIEPDGSSIPQAPESTQETPPALDGTLVDEAANVYGCGNEHTTEVNGVRFHWYDRYEHRSKDNRTVFSSIDIQSFQMRYTEQETLLEQNDIWYIDYEIEVSSGSGAKLRWFTYDKNQYRKDDVPVLNGEIKGKCQGTSYFAQVQMPPSIVTFAELAPSMYGRS